MKLQPVCKLDDADYKLIDLFQQCNMTRQEATCLVYLIRRGSGTSREIVESSPGMDQPQVSIAIRSLIDRGLVVVKEQLPTRTRPSNVYISVFSLSGILDRLITELEIQRGKEYDRLTDMITKLESQNEID